MASSQSARATLIWAIGAMSFAYAFFHRVAPSVMVGDLMRDFAVGAALLGNLSAIYFYAYAGLQIPLGFALDRWGARRMLTAGAVLAAVGGCIFALATGLWLAYLGRFLVGVGAAVGFIGTLKLVAHWFPADRFAFFSGMTMLVAMAGGIGGQAPLAAAVQVAGWRHTMLIAGLAGLLLALLTWILVRDNPPGERPGAGHANAKGDLWRDFRQVLTSRQNWIIALYGGAMTAPLLSYAGLWSVPHVMQRFGVSRTTAAATASLMLIGWAIGSPAGGWISDRLRRRRAPMAAFAALVLICWLAMLYLPGLTLFGHQVLMFAAGAVGGGMVICIAAAREQAPARVAGATAGLINTAMVASGALLQPLIGTLLDARWEGAMTAGARSYSSEAFVGALLALPACAAVALLATMFVRETGARPL